MSVLKLSSRTFHPIKHNILILGFIPTDRRDESKISTGAKATTVTGNVSFRWPLPSTTTILVVKRMQP